MSFIQRTRSYFGPAIDAIASRELLFQRIQARAEHVTAHRMAIETDAYPNGREMISSAGVKRNANANRQTVDV